MHQLDKPYFRTILEVTSFLVKKQFTDTQTIFFLNTHYSKPNTLHVTLRIKETLCY